MSDLFAGQELDECTGATFSPCRKWRYALWRIWDRSKPHATFCLMNGSTADEVNNDPTVERQKRRTEMWAERGWYDVGGVKVVNAFGWRETDSRKLPKLVEAGIDIVGPANDNAILDACQGAAIVVCGWGRPGHQLLGRGPKVLALLKAAGIQPYALHVNTDGSPCHPLYLPYSAQPQAFS